MNLPSGSQKWVLGLLALVAVGLAGNLVWQYRKMQPGTTQAQVVAANATHPRVGNVHPHSTDDLAKYDPDVHFGDLKNLDSRPLPDEDRDPFQFVGGIAAPAPVQAGGPAVAPVAPAAPPPPPLKAVGYNELPGGQKEAMVTFNDDLSVVHEGDTVGVKFKVLTISPSVVVVEDADTHEKIDLPIAQ